MSSYSSTSLSSYEPASSSSSDRPSSPSTSPGTCPPSPVSPKSPTRLQKAPTFPLIQTPTSSSRAQSTPKPAASQRDRALTLDARPHGIGVDPTSLVGKKLTRVRRSRTHPCITLQFADRSSFQVLVVGYDPQYRGVPKVLESDSPILNPRASNGTVDVRLTISQAAYVTLSDKAFQVQVLPAPKPPALSRSTSWTKGAAPEKQKEDRWTQRHAAFALKFEEEPGWHCVWATMAEYDAQIGERCVFRNYADVYLDRLPTRSHTRAVPSISVPTTTQPHGLDSTSGSTSTSTSAESVPPRERGHKGKRKPHKKKGAGQGGGGGDNRRRSPSPVPRQLARW